PMQKIVFDRLRPAGRKDPAGVDDARTTLRTAYDMIEREMATKMWARSERFGMADCAAAPALYSAELVEPFRHAHRNAAAYLERLMRRAWFARVARAAETHRP